ncbi:nucleotidyltransferase/DNA polymerase involved in DNA repair [Hoeflea sp. IMCC20628]|uniref:Y-family DNA polymerase n=1 Tax=Hoeflea sp. IMCC20628 TaxID=1620421 RepID=UPI00063BDBAC|nr:DNA polymerase Y family protein [Hoeflea sp. IMCC20628]AKI02405.1 nucleotidyltransferase/DNA polymerase involved in DNA repair [Hoeflea sp. IMCC20628]
MDAHPEAPPVVVTDTLKNAIRIVALDQRAHARGVRLNQTLSDARALVPDLDCHPADDEQTQALLLKIAGWCERYTPLVALGSDPEDGHDHGLFMDITGCAHLLGGEAAVIADLEARLRAQGFHVRLCLADTPGAGWAMARYGQARIIAEDAHAEAILPLSLSGLRLPSAMVASLGRVGLKTIGCIANLPRAPLAARFGARLMQRLDQALGRETESISPIMPVADLSTERRFAEPVTHQDEISHVIAALAAGILEPLERRGLGLRHCRLKLFRVDGHVSQLSVQTARPLRDARMISRLFEERIAGLHDDLDAGFGFDLIRLDVVHADPFEAAQAEMMAGQAAGQGHDALVDRLGARLGLERVQRFVLADTHIPERSFGRQPVAHLGGAGSGTRRSAMGNAMLASAPYSEISDGVTTRPLILFDRPELLQTIAEVPDGPPFRFRWRGVSHEVVRSEGPERIACEWWRDGRGARTRDYFRVEDHQGYRFWLFRHGLYGRETDDPCWYMHGLFA